MSLRITRRCAGLRLPWRGVASASNDVVQHVEGHAWTPIHATAFVQSMKHCKQHDSSARHG